MATREKIYSDLAIPPGVMLAEEIEARGMSQRELAERTDRPEQAISEIINGKKAITAETALQLEKVLGVSSAFWTNLEARYQETLARINENEELQRQEAQLDNFPVREMKQRGLLPNTKDKRDLLNALLSYFGYASFDALRRAHQDGVLGYRVTPAANVSRGALYVWMREGEIAAAEIKTQPYSQGRFGAALREVRALTTEAWDAAYPRIVEICAGAGVALVITRQYPKSGASGVARWAAPDKAMIQLSTRRNYVDMFWFSLFHEAKHVLDRQKKRVFVNGIDDNPEEEAEADRFAGRFLIPEEEYRTFANSQSQAKAAVRAFASSVGIHPGVVVGRLQRDGVIPRSHMNDLRRRFIWKEE